MASLNRVMLIGNAGRDAEPGAHLPDAGVLARFWPKVRASADPDHPACLIWHGSRNGYGYGQLSSCRGQAPYKAHRLAWWIRNGREPEPHEHVLHACDNPPCVNPDHLSIGDPSKNAQDRSDRGRTRPGWVPGERNGMAKLTEHAVLEIRKQADRGVSYATLARRFQVDPSLIRRVARREVWRHV